jgi:hypothetical protein
LRVDDSIKIIDEKIHGFCGEKKTWIKLEEEVFTYNKVGKDPFSRSLDELLDLGVINIDKPPGPTSHEVVAWIKRMLNVARAGHGGTLESRGPSGS